MKFVKFSALALTLGLFFASCGGGETTEGETIIEETTVAPEIEEPIAPATVDTTLVPAEDPAVEPAPAP